MVLISDNVSNVKATMFDDTLEVLIKTNFHELITKGGYDDNKHLPKPIAETVGQRWFFVLKPQREQYPSAPKFIVKQILPMNAINKPLLLETPPPSTPDPAIIISEQTTTTKKKLDFSGQGNHIYN